MRVFLSVCLSLLVLGCNKQDSKEEAIQKKFEAIEAERAIRAEENKWEDFFERNPAARKDYVKTGKPIPLYKKK